jgi:hypothetical protein
MMEVYTELSAGWNRACSLDSVFTRYLLGAMTSSNSMSGLMLTTPDINIGGGLGSVCWAGAPSEVSSISVLNRFVVVRASPNQ